ncbi:MAG TPA: nucleotide exchange factor GrpE [Clostridiales bacterium]|nr:nucleotide exchange factor GrpE [Clostridiales bacterium]
MAKSAHENKKKENASEEEVISFETDSTIREEEPKKNPEADALREELKKEKDDYLRLRADYENFRRRNQEATVNARREGAADAVEAILPAIDSIDRALGICSDEKAKEGILLIKKQIETSLSQIGVTEIPAEGQPFDHNLHNAVQRSEVEEESVGKVLEVYQRGYKIGNKVIRYAMVKVGVEKSE